MGQYYVKKMVAVSMVVEANDKSAAEALADTFPVQVTGGWDYEYSDTTEVEEAAE